MSWFFFSFSVYTLGVVEYSPISAERLPMPMYSSSVQPSSTPLRICGSNTTIRTTSGPTRSRTLTDILTSTATTTCDTTWFMTARRGSLLLKKHGRDSFQCRNFELIIFWPQCKRRFLRNRGPNQTPSWNLRFYYLFHVCDWFRVGPIDSLAFVAISPAFKNKKIIWIKPFLFLLLHFDSSLLALRLTHP